MAKRPRDGSLPPTPRGREAASDTEILFVRTCKAALSAEECAREFAEWHPPEFRRAFPGRDPCLSERGACAASTGVPGGAGSEGGAEEGLQGGLVPLLRCFAPQLIVCSAQSAALQTALLARGEEGSLGGPQQQRRRRLRVPIIVHPGLSLRLDDPWQPPAQQQQQQPQAPFLGLDRAALSERLARHYYPGGGGEGDNNESVDLSLLPAAVPWFDPSLDFKARRKALRLLPAWFASRPESRIMVVTHGPVLKRLTFCKVGHGQYTRARLSEGGELFCKPSLALFEHHYISHPGSSPRGGGCEEGRRPTKQLLCIRHCQDEVLGDPTRVVAPRFDVRAVTHILARELPPSSLCCSSPPTPLDPHSHRVSLAGRGAQAWHTAAFRAENEAGAGGRDPCLTELGVQVPARACARVAHALRTRCTRCTRFACGEAGGGGWGGCAAPPHSTDRLTVDSADRALSLLDLSWGRSRAQALATKPCAWR
jgi:hypothetical protein